MKQIFGLFALLLGVCAANAQTADTVKYAAGNDLYRGITRKLPYRQMVTPYGVEVTFAKTVHIIFPAAVRYVDLGSIRDVPLLKTDKYRAKIHKTYYRRIKTDKFIFKKRLYIIAGQ